MVEGAAAHAGRIAALSGDPGDVGHVVEERGHALRDCKAAIRTSRNRFLCRGFIITHAMNIGRPEGRGPLWNQDKVRDEQGKT